MCASWVIGPADRSRQRRDLDHFRLLVEDQPPPAILLCRAQGKRDAPKSLLAGRQRLQCLYNVWMPGGCFTNPACREMCRQVYGSELGHCNPSCRGRQSAQTMSGCRPPPGRNVCTRRWLDGVAIMLPLLWNDKSAVPGERFCVVRVSRLYQYCNRFTNLYKWRIM
jgi:hypothetical protein